MATYHIRRMTLPEVQRIAVEWAAAEGWNPGLEDATGFYETDPEGFLVGLLDEEPIACISAVRYPPDFGFIGFYIVRPEYRGQGYGFQIWQAAMRQLKNRNIGLDGVVAQQANYRRSGFQLAYNNIRYEDKASGHRLQEPSDHLIPCDRLPIESIAAYDRRFFPTARPAFLAAWLRQPDSRALAWVDQGQINGFGMIRPCRSGFKIGPLFADTADLAKQLFVALIQELPAETPFYLDVPAANPEAVALAERYGLKPVFETARMYTQDAPAIAVSGIFGVTTFELG
ncbi:GNAT family N-acetyltransferase [Larkinella bovis]|uniref:GNAT family N-acetyltransferase n=1 Tax=Larkinella bovis TaxID=683041 RepID=A0ABW0IGS6_9BACT